MINLLFAIFARLLAGHQIHLKSEIIKSLFYSMGCLKMLARQFKLLAKNIYCFITTSYRKIQAHVYRRVRPLDGGQHY